MQATRRVLLAVALSTFLAACGGSDDDPGNLAVDTSEARGGKKGANGGGGGDGGTTPAPSPTGAYVTAANTVYGGYTTVKFYPASSINGQLALGVRCYQGGTLVWEGATWELHYAVGRGVPGYSFVSDHFEVVFGPFNIAAGAACVVNGYDSGALIASGTFSVAAQ